MAEELAMIVEECEGIAGDEAGNLQPVNYKVPAGENGRCYFINSCSYADISRESICTKGWQSRSFCDIFRNSFDDGR
ncbi:MAG TPA: hypothetical protein ENN30_00640 [Candidatus Woesearchaeota archaeon]|nr:hypothetical protein [Candidatus Woesearchaeota archaeon]